MYIVIFMKRMVWNKGTSAFSSFPVQLVINRRVPPYEPGPVQGLFLLKSCFYLPLLLGEGPALGFYKCPRCNFDYRRDFTNNE